MLCSVVIIMFLGFSKKGKVGLVSKSILIFKYEQ